MTCTFQNAGEEGNDPRVLIERLARHTFVTDLMPDLMRRAIRPSDIVAAKQEGKHCRYMTATGFRFRAINVRFRRRCGLSERSSSLGFG